MQTTPSPSIHITGLEKSFGSTHVLAGVDLTAHPGRVTGLLGPNGSGKSTTIKCLVGLCRPDAGQALLLDRDYAQHPEPSRVVGVALDSMTADPTMRGRDHLRVYAAMAGLPTARVDECLEALDMTAYATRRIGGWSTGMRQRLSLATALLGEPQVIILDEPTNGLDPDGIEWVRRFLREMADQDRTVLVSSHVLAEFEQILDDIIIIRQGSTAMAGPLRDLKKHTGMSSLEALYHSSAQEHAA